MRRGESARGADGLDNAERIRGSGRCTSYVGPEARPRPEEATIGAKD